MKQLLKEESDNELIKILEQIIKLYNVLCINDNKDAIDEYSKLFYNFVDKKYFKINTPRKFTNIILEMFYLFLIRSGKSEKTAYDYVKRIERICKELNISVQDLFFRRSGYSINDIIGMYSKGGIKSSENIKKHSAPLCASKQFSIFMDDLKNNKEESDISPLVNFYLREEEGYQSWEILSKHPCSIVIKNKICTITYKENRKVSNTITKKINNKNYADLMNVFHKYKNILSNDTNLSMQKFPFGGVHSYYYKFEDISNFYGCASLFESDNRTLLSKAYSEYYAVLDNIINQK